MERSFDGICLIDRKRHKWDDLPMIAQCYLDFHARAVAIFETAEAKASRPHCPKTPLAPIIHAAPISGRSRGRPRLSYARGDLVCVGGVDGVYVRRWPGTRGRVHQIKTELPSHGRGERRSALLLVAGPVFVLQRVQLEFSF